MRSTFIAIGVVLLLAGGSAMTACSSQPDDPREKVSTALKNANIENVDVDYDSNERVIHLTGNVENPAERARAEEVAERAVGTSGTVLNEVTVAGMNEQMADDHDSTISAQLDQMIDNDPSLTDRDINFSVNNGAVEISGTVASNGEKTRVSEIVRGVHGVGDVANSLEVKADAAGAKRPMNDMPAATSDEPPRRNY